MAAIPVPSQSAQPDDKPVYADRWLYCQFNLQVEKSADEVVELINRGRDNAAKGVPGVTGFMYTTWRHGFGQLEAFGKAMQRK